MNLFNNLKRITLMLFFALFTLNLVGCLEEDVQELSIKSKDIRFTAEPEEYSKVIEIKTDGRDWEITDVIEKPSEDNATEKTPIKWLKVAKKESSLFINVEQNTNTKAREGRIVITSGSDKKYLDVFQEKLIAYIKIDKTDVNDILSADNETEIEIPVEANIDFTLEPISENWVEFKTKSESQDGLIKTRIYVFTVKKNTSVDPRNMNISFKAADGSNYSQSFTVKQKGVEGKLILNSSITSATDDYHETDNPNAPGWGDGPISFALDKDMNTKFHSKYDQPIFPDNAFNLDVNFASGTNMDYIIYHPRTNGSGAFRKVEIWYSSATQTTLTKLMDFENFESGNNYTKISFPEKIENITQIRMRVIKCEGNKNATCAELEFFYY